MDKIMTATEVLQQLEALGTEQNRKTYKRHGARPPCFGVSFANLENLRKKIKRDHALATELWATGNFDACNLATMIADPQSMSSRELDEWAKGITSMGLGEMFARHILSKSKFARPKLEKWTASSNELLGESAFTTLACYAMENQDEPDSYFERWIEHIENGIHKAKNYVRHAMNGALIAIGMRNPRLQKIAIAAAGRIGKVEVDHGDTACQTPDAATYIKKAAARTAAKKAARAAAK